jgi:hypothetical protein
MPGSSSVKSTPFSVSLFTLYEPRRFHLSIASASVHVSVGEMLGPNV